MICTLVRLITGSLGLLFHDQQPVTRASEVDIPELILINPRKGVFCDHRLGFCFALTGFYDHFITAKGKKTFGQVYEDGVWTSGPIGNPFSFDPTTCSVDELIDQIAVWVANPMLFGITERTTVRQAFDDLRAVMSIKGETQEYDKLYAEFNVGTQEVQGEEVNNDPDGD